MIRLARYCFFLLVFLFMENGQVFGRGIDDLARIGRNADHAADIGRAVRGSQRLNRLSPYAADVLKIGVINADDITRLSLYRADDVARLGLQQGDDLFRNFSQFHRRMNSSNFVVGQLDSIPSGLSRTDYRKAFSGIYGEQTRKALSAYTGDHYNNIQKVARGGQLANPGAHERTLMKVRRLDNLTNSHHIQSSAIFPRVIKESPEELAEIFNTGSLRGKNINEMADLIKNKNTLNKGFTSANLPTTPIEQINDWAIYGFPGRQMNNNNIIVLRELSVSEGTRGFIVPNQVSMYSQEQVIFHRGLRTKVIEATPDIIKGRDGKIYNIIHTLEEVIP